MSTSSEARDDISASPASGMRALRPLPRAGRFSMVSSQLSAISSRLSAYGRSELVAFEHFVRKREVGVGAAGFRIVGHGRQAVTGRFGEAYVARDDGAIDLVLEELAHVARDLLAEVGALVVHRQQDALDVE